MEEKDDRYCACLDLVLSFCFGERFIVYLSWAGQEISRNVVDWDHSRRLLVPCGFAKEFTEAGISNRKVSEIFQIMNSFISFVTYNSEKMRFVVKFSKQ